MELTRSVEGSSSDLRENQGISLNLEEIVREVLDTRPAVVATRRPTTIERSSNVRRSLPASTGSTSRIVTSPHKRSRSLHYNRSKNSPERTKNVSVVVPPTTQDDVVITDLENEDIITQGLPQFEVTTVFKREDELRKSTAPLRHRLAEQRRLTVMDRNRGIRTSCWADLKYVKWPKIKSRFQVLLSQELWKSHLKEVEGLFGTAVVSYFVFLRWIFIMNIVIFFLWFGIICIPQVIYQVRNPGSSNTTSSIACLINISNGSVNECSNRSLSITGGITERYSVPSNCLQEPDNDIRMKVIQECSFSDNIAVSENGIQRPVSEFLLDESCNMVDPLTNQDLLANTTVYRVCVGVDPLVPWYQYILDFISGTGLFNETLLFQGVYPNESIDGYSFSLAFIFMTALVYFVGVILLIFKMGQAFNESYVNFSTKRRVNFSNKLFTAWDFNITEPKTAKLRQAHIRTDFQEELLDLQAREKKRTVKEFCLVLFIRLITNSFVLLTLAGAGAAIYYSANYEFQINTSGVEIPIIGEYLSAIVISVLNAVLPLVFQLVAKVEKYKTTTGAVRITLLRTVLVRLSSLVVLLASLYVVIAECTQPVVSNDDECTITAFTSSFTFNNDTNTSQIVCPVCWETFIGQQFYKLGITNLFVSVAATILIETGRHILSRLIVHLKWKDLGNKIGRFLTKGNFNIPKSILDLIYTQTLLWLGFLFSPLLPFIVLLTSFLLFYAKKYSLILNLEPDKQGFQRSARRNFLFLLLMLLALFVSIVPVLYALVQLQPSTTCGPFRGQSSMLQAFNDLINEGTCGVQITIDFFTSSAFVVPLIIVLILTCYALAVILKARNARFKLIKKQLILEGANVAHIVGNLNEALQHLAVARSQQEQAEYLSQTIERRSRLLTTFNTSEF